METRSRRTSRTRLSGVMMLVAVALIFLFILIMAELLPEWLQTVLTAAWWALGPLLFLGLALPYTGHEIIVTLYGTFLLLAVIAAVIGGFAALRGQNRKLMALGCIGAVLVSPPFGILAMILLQLGKDELARERRLEDRFETKL